MSARVVAATSLAVLALSGTSIARSAPAFHNTEAIGLDALLTPRGSRGDVGYFTSTLTVVKGKAEARLAWTLVVEGTRRRIVAVTVHRRRSDGALGPVLATLCEPCAHVTRGRAIFPTASPWFRPERTMASIPTLVVRVMAAPGPTAIDAELVRVSWRGYLS